MPREIPLSQGKVAVVDDSDYEKVAAFKWHALKYKKTFYARRYVHDGTRKTVQSMHSLILGAVAGCLVDHRDRNGLNNQRSNLRPANKSLNSANACKRSDGITSRFKGVSLHSKSQKWLVSIKKNGKGRHLGYFTDEEEAARTYDAAAKEHFGEFARLNFPAKAGA